MTTADSALSHAEQQEITRLCVHTALLLLQHGAESTLVSQIATRLGKALGVESVEVALTTNAVVLTTLHQGHCITTARRNQDQGINMHVVTEVQHIVIAAEHRIYDSAVVRKKLYHIKPLKYNRYYVLLMVGLSCASFAHLAGGDALICLITFLAACVAMFVRQTLALRHYNPMIVFACTAFVATCISGLSLRFALGNDPQIAIASSVLLLVPGFPFINALSDILKGYTNMGIGRWALATVLTFGACIGIVFALSLLNISQWGVEMGLLLTLLDDMVFAAIPAVGFALLFNVPQNALKYCALLGAIGHGLRTLLLLAFDMPLVFATFFAAALIGFIGVYLSQRYLAHPKVFTVAAIIPMIPGVFAYKAMIAVVQIYHIGYSETLFQQAVDNFVKSGFILGALAFGLALPGLLFYRRRPVI